MGVYPPNMYSATPKMNHNSTVPLQVGSNLSPLDYGMIAIACAVAATILVYFFRKIKSVMTNPSSNSFPANTDEERPFFGKKKDEGNDYGNNLAASSSIIKDSPEGKATYSSISETSKNPGQSKESSNIVQENSTAKENYQTSGMKEDDQKLLLIIDETATNLEGSIEKKVVVVLEKTPECYTTETSKESSVDRPSRKRQAPQPAPSAPPITENSLRSVGEALGGILKDQIPEIICTHNGAVTPNTPAIGDLGSAKEENPATVTKINDEIEDTEKSGTYVNSEIENDAGSEYFSAEDVPDSANSKNENYEYLDEPSEKSYNSFKDEISPGQVEDSQEMDSSLQNNQELVDQCPEVCLKKTAYLTYTPQPNNPSGNQKTEYSRLTNQHATHKRTGSYAYDITQSLHSNLLSSNQENTYQTTNTISSQENQQIPKPGSLHYNTEIITTEDGRRRSLEEDIADSLSNSNEDEQSKPEEDQTGNIPIEESNQQKNDSYENSSSSSGFNIDENLENYFQPITESDESEPSVFNGSPTESDTLPEAEENQRRSRLNAEIEDPEAFELNDEMLFPRNPHLQNLMINGKVTIPHYAGEDAETVVNEIIKTSEINITDYIILKDQGSDLAKNIENVIVQERIMNIEENRDLKEFIVPKQKGPGELQKDTEQTFTPIDVLGPEITTSGTDSLEAEERDLRDFIIPKKQYFDEKYQQGSTESNFESEGNREKAFTGNISPEEGEKYLSEIDKNESSSGAITTEDGYPKRNCKWYVPTDEILELQPQRTILEVNSNTQELATDKSYITLQEEKISSFNNLKNIGENEGEIVSNETITRKSLLHLEVDQISDFPNEMWPKHLPKNIKPTHKDPIDVETTDALETNESSSEVTTTTEDEYPKRNCKWYVPTDEILELQPQRTILEVNSNTQELTTDKSYITLQEEKISSLNNLKNIGETEGFSNESIKKKSWVYLEVDQVSDFPNEVWPKHLPKNIDENMKPFQKDPIYAKTTDAVETNESRQNLSETSSELIKQPSYIPKFEIPNMDRRLARKKRLRRRQIKSLDSGVHHYYGEYMDLVEYPNIEESSEITEAANDRPLALGKDKVKIPGDIKEIEVEEIVTVEIDGTIKEEQILIDHTPQY